MRLPAFSDGRVVVEPVTIRRLVDKQGLLHWRVRHVGETERGRSVEIASQPWVRCELPKEGVQ
jgi:hypothetical protein